MRLFHRRTVKMNLNFNMMFVPMPTVSMVQLRQDAEAVLRRVEQGEHLVLTYRGKPVARLSPYDSTTPPADDPFYRLTDPAVDGGETLTNEQIDEIIHGQ